MAAAAVLKSRKIVIDWHKCASVHWICECNFDICCFRGVAFTIKKNWFEFCFIMTRCWSVFTCCAKVCFRLRLRRAFITLVLKKPGRDATSASSYRPISNLSVLLKLLKHLVARQLMECLYLSLDDFFPPDQSGFRQGHLFSNSNLWN